MRPNTSKYDITLLLIKFGVGTAHVAYCLTTEMTGEFFTKTSPRIPIFPKFCTQILNLKPQPPPPPPPPPPDQKECDGAYDI